MYSERQLSRKVIDAIAIVIGSDSNVSLQMAKINDQKKAIDILMLDGVFNRSIKYYASLEGVTEKEYVAVVVAVGLCLFAEMRAQGSAGEKVIASLLGDAGIFYEREKTFPGMADARPLRLDFYLPDYNVAIEYQGKQHFEPISHFGGDDTLKNAQRRDAIKLRFCQANDIELRFINYDQDIEKELELILQSLAV